ncbi:MAG: cytochrome c biogenesis protein CcsA [Ignavibacteriales bacterium]|nr:cytochrome c biogenesis protein CcsA [Ignavibacteriales bacterium]
MFVVGVRVRHRERRLPVPAVGREPTGSPLAAGELVVLFGLIVLVTGPLWARKAWGVWWEWDARLTSSLLLWMIFLALPARAPLRRARAPRSSPAAMALFGMANVPFVYVSVNYWRTLHPKTSVVMTAGAGHARRVLVLRRGVRDAVRAVADAAASGSRIGRRWWSSSTSPPTNRRRRRVRARPRR